MASPSLHPADVAVTERVLNGPCSVKGLKAHRKVVWIAYYYRRRDQCRLEVQVSMVGRSLGTRRDAKCVEVDMVDCQTGPEGTQI